MQRDANIRLHHTILGVVPLKRVFLEGCAAIEKRFRVEHPRTGPTCQMAELSFATACLNSTPAFSRGSRRGSPNGCAADIHRLGVMLQLM